jgi:hypothetical protein
MDKVDICNLRQWYRDAARRAQIAGYDIAYPNRKTGSRPHPHSDQWHSDANCWLCSCYTP